MSNPNTDLETVIADAVNDSIVPDAPVETEVTETVVEDTPAIEETPIESAQVSAPGTEAPVEEPVAEAAVDTAPKDDFERLAGMPAIGASGRENRIPYSRVQKITQKAVSEVAEAVLGRKLAPGEKPAEVVKARMAELSALQPKVQEYEARLTKVGEFENVMANEPKRFLQMMEGIPVYKPFFDAVRAAFAAQQGQATPTGVATGQPSVATTEEDPMPEPNEELADGSKIYNMEGIKSLLAWNARQTESRVTKQIEERYKPIESEWKHRQQLESVMPVIRKQIEEAKTWPLFTENEEEITKLLNEDQHISLEGAYRKVVLPKLVVDRTQVRQQVIAELQTAPKSTAVTGNKSATKPAAPTGPRKLEDIIAEQVEALKRP